jgi:adenine-specific DNA methylase
MQKTLIEEKRIELLKLFLEISEEAKKEKQGRPPINEILYWWTRKPLIVGRAITLLSLTPPSANIDRIKQLLTPIKGERAFKLSLNKRDVEELASTDLNSLKILDPFAGAGNLLFEACRMELNCILVDYNPVAYLIMKATLEYPTKFGEKLAKDVEKYGKEVIKRVREKLGKFYERKEGRALHYLWCWTIRCPYCGQRIPLTNQMWLNKKRKIGYKIIPTENGEFKVEIGILSEREGQKYTQKGGKAVCIKCGNAISYEEMTKDIAKRRDKEMIAIVTKYVKGKNYETPTNEDKKLFKEAKEELYKNFNELKSLGLIPYEEINPSHRRENPLWYYGIRSWYEFFTERQLLLVSTILKTIREVCSEISNKEYAKVIATYLGFMLCKHINFNCIGTLWNVARETITHALSFRSPHIIYNFAETNPFEDTSGSLSGVLNDIVKGIEFAIKNKASSKVLLGSVLHLKDFLSTKFDVIITDPPYMDDVQYAEHSEFFYVWLIRVLKDYHNELPARVPIDEDIVVSWGRFGNLKLAKDFYARAMKIAFRNIYEILKDDGLLVVFFAHSSAEAWDLLLDVLREARFRVISSYAVHTESIGNPIARGKTSFMSSIVLACRKILKDEEAYIEMLIPRIEESIDRIIESFSIDDILSLPITDLLIMVYGKVLEEVSQYSKIKSYKANFVPNFENLIGDARDYIFRSIVKKLIGSSPNILGPETSFALVGKIFYRGLIPADDALKVTRAYGIELNSLEKKGYIRKLKGNIKISSFVEVDLKVKPENISRNNVYEQLLYIEKLAFEQGVAKVKPILDYDNFRFEELKNIINLLIKHYRLLINKGEELREYEKKELQILENLSDLMATYKPKEVIKLDKFFDNQ